MSRSGTERTSGQNVQKQNGKNFWTECPKAEHKELLDRMSKSGTGETMQLDDYLYAGPYIESAQKDFRKLRKLADNAQKYHDMAYHITQTFHLDSGMVSHNPSRTADAILNLIDAKELCDGFWERCMESCKELFKVEDVDGVMIIFYYYFLGYSMNKIEGILNMSKRTCWRHQKAALEELDDMLGRK